MKLDPGEDIHTYFVIEKIGSLNVSQFSRTIKVLYNTTSTRFSLKITLCMFMPSLIQLQREPRKGMLNVTTTFSVLKASSV